MARGGQALMQASASHAFVTLETHRQSSGFEGKGPGRADRYAGAAGSAAVFVAGDILAEGLNLDPAVQ